MKSGNLNFLEPSGSLQACNGTALPLLLSQYVNKQPYDNNNLLLSLIILLNAGYLQSYRLGLCSYVMVIYIALGRRPHR